MDRSSSPSRRISDAVRERGPITVAAFMELALYDPELGYYARAVQRSGRAGDFFTSVDVGPLFGTLIATQLDEMRQLLDAGVRLQATGPREDPSPEAGRPKPEASPEARSLEPEAWFSLVEAGAGNGRLSADILHAARRDHPGLYEATELHLVERSQAARDAQRDTLGDAADRLASSGSRLPDGFTGVLLANELLDALPVHQVVMTPDGVREVYVTVDEERGGLQAIEGPTSTPALLQYLERAGVTLETGWRAEINLHAIDWVRDAARRIRRGFLMLVDYGHDARELYSAPRAAGTLTAFSGHTSAHATGTSTPRGWLQRPGEQDLTSHVDFTSVRLAAEAEGLVTLGFLDQTYFLLGLVGNRPPPDMRESLALKTLLMPGGLGSTHKVLLLGKDVGTPRLRGCSFRVRVT